MTSVFPDMQKYGALDDAPVSGSGTKSITFPHDLAVSSPAPFPAVFVATPPAVGAVRGQGAFHSVTHGPAGTSAEAGHDPHANGGRIARLASLLHRMASALCRRNRGADGAGEGVGHIIGRRAERLNNRNRAAADRYVEVHRILARGRA